MALQLLQLIAGVMDRLAPLPLEMSLQWLDDRGITPYIRVKEGPNSPPDLYGIEKFTYVAEENCYLCPAGKPLN